MRSSATIKYSTFVLSTFIALLGYLYLAYTHERTDFYTFLLVYASLFGVYLYAVKADIPFRGLIVLGILFRLVFVGAFPILSDDYFRFFWDGTLLSQGFNPYLHLPADFIKNPPATDLGLNQALFESLNSQNYYTVYPPINQGVFALGAWLSFGNIWLAIIVMRLVILVAELGALYCIIALLKHYQLSRNQALWYWLNPLVIVEATGNLHFEAMMFAFLLGGIYFLQVKKNIPLGALFFTLAISTKLIPLLLMPLMWRYLGFKKGFWFCAFTGIFLLISFLPFISLELITNFGSSIELYFQKFEFNASIYYVLRAIGFQVYGYNIIATLGRVLSVLSLLSILGIAFFSVQQKDKDLPKAMLWTLAMYYVLATTVHPWYALMLVGLSIFTTYRFAFVWSFAVIFSYSAYQSLDYQENLYWVTLEYILVIGYWIWEYFYAQKVSVENSIKS
jgi:hypothetical protein